MQRPTWNPPSPASRDAVRGTRIWRKLHARGLAISNYGVAKLRLRAIRAQFRGAAFAYLDAAKISRHHAYVERCCGMDPNLSTETARYALAEAHDRAQLWAIAGGHLP